MANEKECLECGTALPKEAQFCYNCGAKCTETTKKTEVCLVCGELLSPNAKFCCACGEKVPDLNSLTDKAEEKSSCKKCKRIKRDSLAFLIIQKSVISFFAFVMLAFAFFPIVKIEQTHSLPTGKMQANVSAIDTVVFFVDSLNRSITDARHFDAKVEEEIAEYKNNYDYLYPEDRAEMAHRIQKLKFRQLLKNGAISLGIGGTICAVMSIGYILCITAMAVMAFVDLILLLRRKGNSGLFKKYRALFCAIPIFSFVLYTVATITYGNIVIFTHSVRCKITWSVLLTVIISLALLAYIAVDRIFFAERKKARVGEIVRRSFALVGATVLLLSVFLPVFRLEIMTDFKNSNGKFSNASVSRGYEFFPIFGCVSTVADKFHGSHYSNIQESYQEIAELTKTQFEDEYLDSTVDFMITESAVSYWDSDFVWVYKDVSYLGIFIALIAGALIWQSVYAVAFGVRPKRSLSKCLSASSAALSFVALAFSIFMVEFWTVRLENAIYNLKGWAWFSLGSATVIALIFSVMMFVVSCFEKRKSSIEIESVEAI